MIYKVDLKGSFLMPRASAVVANETLAQHTAELTYVSPLFTFRPYFERQEFDDYNNMTVYGSFTVNAYTLIETKEIERLSDLIALKAGALDSPIDRINTLLQGLEKELGMLLFTKDVTVCPADLVPSELAEHLYYAEGLDAQGR